MDISETIFTLIDNTKTSPALFTLNGVGADLFGHYSPYYVGDLVFKIHFFCLVFIPIIPLGIYLVRVDDLNPIEGTTYSIYGKLSFFKFFNLFGFSVIPVFLFTIFSDIVGKLIALSLIIGLMVVLSYGIPALFS